MRSRILSGLLGAVLVTGTLMAGSGPAVAQGDTLVNVGTEQQVPFSQNKQNEPAVTIDPSHPWLVAAGANDNIDMEACNAGAPTDCPFTTDIGGSGVYFSFDSGHGWTQPEYTGLTARNCLGDPDPTVTTDTCVPEQGPIGTLPHYDSNGLVSDGDPALVFGPAPGEGGGFSWDNGSRLYYANLASKLTTSDAFKGAEAIAVSRMDFPADVTADSAPDVVADADNWADPVIVSKQASTTFSDKEQIFVDNAESSPFFGNAYVCIASFRSNSHGNAAPQPLLVATSTDGGDSWTVKQVTSASNNPFNTKQGFGRSGCSVRTTSDGTVYVFANQFAVGTPGQGSHIMITSTNGGKNWSRPENIGSAVDTCFDVQFDGTSFRCVMDGLAGARDDLSSAPSVDIANGAPEGGGPDVMYRTWVDGRDGVDDPHVFLSYSVDGGDTWSTPQAVEQGDDRGYYSAVALSPDGTDAYLVYNAFTTPFQDTTDSLRGLVGVVLHATVDPATGAPGVWTEVHRGEVGDPRSSSQNNIVLEFLGDYVYAWATNDYGVAVWNDSRRGEPCDAVNEWRAGVQDTLSLAGRPAIQEECSIDFGNSDIFGWSSG
jgi:hypothetical protein